MFDGREQLEEALHTLGALLEHRGISHELVAVGGASLLLQGLVDRPTIDLDVVASVGPTGLEVLEALPQTTQRAVADVARELGLPSDWLNVGPGALLRLGLPEGFDTRLHRWQYGTLCLLLADRYDQIHFKLYAAVDQGPDSKHAQDLLLLAPSSAELAVAATWCGTHDPSEAFADQLRQALAFLRWRLGHA